MERWFGEITRKRILRGSFGFQLPQHENPKPFI